MVRKNRLLIASLSLVIAGLLGASSAEAGWHWYGSSGGYYNYGSHGCYGGCMGYSSFGCYGSHGSHGCYGSYGSYGCHGGWRLGSHLHHKVHRLFHHGSWGSHGCSGGSWGCSGGSYGCSGGSSGGCCGGVAYYGCSGGGCSGGSTGGSSGGTIYSKPVTPGTPMAPAPGEAIPEPAPGKQAMLQVDVPEDAVVFVNGTLTKSTGTHRTYVSRGLNEGFQYNYEVRAEAIRDGKKVEETKVVKLKAGDQIDLSFANLQEKQSEETKLTLNVPADATVTLGGNPTVGEGAVRVFTTSRLSGDQAWNNYVIQVSVERDGRVVTREKTITLKAGDSQTLEFDFDDTQVAAR